jgi:hypothetical protein
MNPMEIACLGEPRFDTPLARVVDDLRRMPAHVVRTPGRPTQSEVLFELAGPRAKLFFDPPGLAPE